MAVKGKNNYFRGDLWFDKQVDERTRKALQQRQKDFTKEHADDTDEQLLTYVRKVAAEFGYTPNAGEIIGGEYISRRFGNWDRVIALCGLPKPGKMRPIMERAIYKQEFKRQASLFKQERQAVQQEKVQLRQDAAKQAEAIREEKAQRDQAWAELHCEDTDEQLLEYLQKCAKELGHSPFKAEVDGSSLIVKRFGTWAVALTLAELPLPQGLKPPKPKDINDYRRQAKLRAIENNPQSGLE